MLTLQVMKITFYHKIRPENQTIHSKRQFITN